MLRVHIEYQGDSIELPPGETVVGRDIGCALRFNDPAVSRRHLRFIRRANEVFVEDLDSSNGTLLNGRKVAAPLRIVDGDSIGVGSRVLKVRIIDDENEDAPFTLLLKATDLDVQPEAVPEPVGKPHRNVTLPMHVVKQLQLAHQRCPQCGQLVSELDDECVHCSYRWGDFRPATPTNLRPNPVHHRRHERRPIELHVVYTSSELEVEVVSRDLSMSGVFICSQVLDPVGTECTLALLVDGGPSIRLGGVVRRVVEREERGGEPIGLGVEFVGVGDTEYAWIRTLLAREDRAP